MTPQPQAQDHWSDVYRSKAPDTVSWYQELPRTSLTLLKAAGPLQGQRLIDLGGGASGLCDHALGAGALVTVLDIAEPALQHSQDRLGTKAAAITWLAQDVLTWSPPLKAFDLWHDRAVFHFLTEPQQQEAYLSVLRRALAPGGSVVMATFAPDGPLRCSGLPVQQYSVEDLQRCFGANFQLAESCQENHVTPGGSHQAFTYARFVFQG